MHTYQKSKNKRLFKYCLNCVVFLFSVGEMYYPEGHMDGFKLFTINMKFKCQFLARPCNISVNPKRPC